MRNTRITSYLRCFMRSKVFYQLEGHSYLEQHKYKEEMNRKYEDEYKLEIMQ